MDIHHQFTRNNLPYLQFDAGREQGNIGHIIRVAALDISPSAEWGNTDVTYALMDMTRQINVKYISTLSAGEDPMIIEPHHLMAAYEDPLNNGTPLSFHERKQCQADFADQFNAHFFNHTLRAELQKELQDLTPAQAGKRLLNRLATQGFSLDSISKKHIVDAVFYLDLKAPDVWPQYVDLSDLILREQVCSQSPDRQYEPNRILPLYLPCPLGTTAGEKWQNGCGTALINLKTHAVDDLNIGTGGWDKTGAGEIKSLSETHAEITCIFANGGCNFDRHVVLPSHAQLIMPFTPESPETPEATSPRRTR